MPPERPRKPSPRSSGKPPARGKPADRTRKQPPDRARKQPTERTRRDATDRGRPTRGASTTRGGSSTMRGGAGQRRTRAEPPAQPAKQPPKRWGSVARRGAGSLGEDQATASRIWRDAVKRARDEPAKPRPREAADWSPEVWEEDHAGKPAAAKPAAPAPIRRTRPPRELAPDVAGELTAARGEKRATRLQTRLADAAGAFERERYLDARRMLKPLADEAPGAASVRELYGLTLYHLERWRDAARELEAFRALTGSVEQHPVLADAYRALRRYKKVDELWEELRQASPGAELVAEGRIVAAGARADRGDVTGAISLLEGAKLDLKRPKQHHLRLLYALGDLYERVGDIPKARDLFRRIAEKDRDFYDAADRAKALA